MTTTERRTTLDAVRALVPDITARAEEIEQARTLPRDLVDDLVAAGCFRALVPRSHGGDELALGRRPGDPRGAGPGRRLGGLDGHARCGGTGDCSVTSRRRRSTRCTPPVPT